ncbi:MAG: DUF4331 domain-containing protein [Dehalococcoidia bacterium]
MGSIFKASAVLGVTLAAAAGIAFSAARDHEPIALDASSHREAPAISVDPSVDNTDFYMWVAPDASDSVTLVMNVWPFSNPSGGPNFYLFNTDAAYRFNIDNNGDAEADLVYEFTFRTEIRDGDTFLYNTGPVTSLDDPDLNIRQYMNADRIDMRTNVRSRITSDWPVAPSYVGTKSMPDYQALVDDAIFEIPGTGKFFAGQRDDPFFVDLAVFDLLSIRPGPPGNAGGGADSLARYSVNSIIMQMTKSDLLGDSPIIGAWTTVERGGKQISRLGQPLVNEVVIPLSIKDAFNSIPPSMDAQVPAAVAAVTDPIVAKLLKGIYNVDSPPAPRTDLVTIFLQGIPMLNQPANVTPSEMLRLNTSIPPTNNPNRMGVLGGDNAGFPNGRRPIDDVTDAALRAVAGATPLTPEFNRPPNNQLGDGVDANDKPFLTAFPYIATPEPGDDTYGVRPAP